VAKVWPNGPEVVECARFRVGASVLTCLFVNILKSGNEFPIVPPLLLDTIAAHWPLRGVDRDVMGGGAMAIGPRIHALVLRADVSIFLSGGIAAIWICNSVTITIQAGQIFAVWLRAPCICQVTEAFVIVLQLQFIASNGPAA